MPLPPFARQDLQRLSVIHEMETGLRANAARLKKKLKQAEGGHLAGGASPKGKGGALAERNRRKELAAQQGTALVLALLKGQRVGPGSHTESQQAMFIAREKEPRIKLPVKKPQWYNDPKIKRNVRVGGPLFQREVRQEALHVGYHQLLAKIGESDLSLKQVKNGQTIFAQDGMRAKYANPYFKNADMRGKLVAFIEAGKPKEEGNYNINAYEESQMPVPEKAGRTGASWVSKRTIFHTTSQSPITRHFYSVDRGVDGMDGS